MLMHEIRKHLLCLAALKANMFTVWREYIEISEALHTQQSIVFRNDRKSEVCKLLFDLGF